MIIIFSLLISSLCGLIGGPGLSCDVRLEVYVDKSTVGSLSGDHNRLEDILVLHLHGGKDIFVSFLNNVFLLAQVLADVPRVLCCYVYETVQLQR